MNRILEQGTGWEPCKTCGLPCIIRESCSANGGSISFGCAHCLAQDRNRLLDAAKEALDVLGLCEGRSFDAPEDAEVKALGRRIGFGALMSAASKTWAEWLVEQGMPRGSNFVSGPCLATFEKTVAVLSSAIKASLAYHAPPLPSNTPDGSNG